MSKASKVRRVKYLPEARRWSILMHSAPDNSYATQEMRYAKSNHWRSLFEHSEAINTRRNSTAYTILPMQPSTAKDIITIASRNTPQPASRNTYVWIIGNVVLIASLHLLSITRDPEILQGAHYMNLSYPIHNASSLSNP